LPQALADLGARVTGRIGIELDVVPVATFERMRKTFSSVVFADVSREVRAARAVKSTYEIGWIEKAAEMVRTSMDDALPPRIRAGVREIELMAFLEGDLRARRHQGVIRLRRWNMEMHYGVVSTGASASFPCYFDGPDGLEGLYPAVQQGGGERAIEPHVPILVDFVGGAGGYLADRTRIYCVGEPPAEARDAHDFCLEMLHEITARLRPGASPARIHEEVMTIAARSPFHDRFMGWGENQVGFLGHGIGIDLDELPVIAPGFEAPLEEGNVIAIEPKAFLGGVGAVGVENTYSITRDGFRNLTGGREGIRVVAP
jgi:Xaa-Pro aminopeptidase